MTTTLVTEVILRTTEGAGVTWDTIDPLPQEEGTTSPPGQDTWLHLHPSISKTSIIHCNYLLYQVLFLVTTFRFKTTLNSMHQLDPEHPLPL